MINCVHIHIYDLIQLFSNLFLFGNGELPYDLIQLFSNLFLFGNGELL